MAEIQRREEEKREEKRRKEIAKQVSLLHFSNDIQKKTQFMCIFIWWCFSNRSVLKAWNSQFLLTPPSRGSAHPAQVQLLLT